MKKIVFTGDREDWPHYHGALIKVFEELKKVHRKRKNPFEILVGDCSGVDEIVRELADKYDIPCRVFRADWDKYGLAAGPIRNAEMLKEKPIVVIACHKDLSKSKGTKNCVQQALRKKIPVKQIGHWPF